MEAIPIEPHGAFVSTRTAPYPDARRQGNRPLGFALLTRHQQLSTGGSFFVWQAGKFRVKPLGLETQLGKGRIFSEKE
jgi:hypothetical protein